MTKTILRAAFVTALILTIPFIGARLSDEWSWGFFDFVFMGALIFGAATIIEVGGRYDSPAYRIAVALAVFTSLILIWLNAAVGIIGDGPHNMLYAGVIAAGPIGAVLVRLRPRGMAYTMFAMATLQILVPAIVLFFWDPPFDPGIAPVFGLNAVFAGMFVAAGLLFTKARPSTT